MADLAAFLTLALKAKDAVQEVARAIRDRRSINMDDFVRRHLKANARRRYERRVAVLRATGDA